MAGRKKGLGPLFAFALLIVPVLGAWFFKRPRYDRRKEPPDWASEEERPRTIKLNGYRAKCSIKGRGTPVIFIPGISGISVPLSAYPKMAKRYKCVSYDLRGLAGDGNALKDYGIEQLSEDLNELFAELGLEKAILVGNSYGGTIALRFALDHPEKVRALVLKGTFAKYDMGLLNGFLAFGLKFSPGFVYRFFVKRHVKDVVADGEPGWAFDYVLKCDLSIPRKTAVQRVESLKKFDVRPRLGEIKAPALIVTGSKDELTGLRYQLYLSGKLPNSYLKVIEGVGHLVDILKPEEYERAIIGFLSSPAVRASRAGH